MYVCAEALPTFGVSPLYLVYFDAPAVRCFGGPSTSLRPSK